MAGVCDDQTITLRIEAHLSRLVLPIFSLEINYCNEAIRF